MPALFSPHWKPLGRYHNYQAISAIANQQRHLYKTRMAANDGHCGPPGKAWDGSPVGKEVKVAGLDAYITGVRDNPGATIVFIHDIYGWKAKNARLLADKYAAAGYLVTIPDFYYGDKYPTDDPEARGTFFANNPFERAYKDLEKVFSDLESTYGKTHVGLQGFCWGGNPALHLAGYQEGKTIDAAVIPHGSFIKLEAVEAAKAPVLFLFANDEDSQIPGPLRKQIQSVLDSKPGFAGKHYPNQQHGWSLRGDVSDPAVAEGATDAYETALAFFKKNVPVS